MSGDTDKGERGEQRRRWAIRGLALLIVSFVYVGTYCALRTTGYFQTARERLTRVGASRGGSSHELEMMLKKAADTDVVHHPGDVTFVSGSVSLLFFPARMVETAWLRMTSRSP